MDTSYLDKKNEIWQMIKEFIEENEIMTVRSIYQKDFLGNELEDLIANCCDTYFNKDEDKE